MLLLVAPTAADGIHFVADFAFMYPAADGTVVAAEVVILPDMHCSPAVGAVTAVIFDVVVIVAASDAGAAIVAVSVAAVFAGAVAVGVSMFSSLSAAAPSTPIFVQYKPALLHIFCHYLPTSCACSIRQRFLLRAHACTFVHVGLLTFDIRHMDLFLA